MSNADVEKSLIFMTENTGTVTYFGEAVPGTATSSAKWRIAEMTNATKTILYANGGTFTAVWDDRAAETYA